MIVLDASAWVDILVGTALPPDPEHEVVVPPHFDAEVVGALRRLVHRGLLSDDKAETALYRHLRADFPAVREEGDIRLAWRWRETMSFTDAWYAALALRLGATLVTTDRPAASAATRLGIAASAPAPDG